MSMSAGELEATDGIMTDCMSKKEKKKINSSIKTFKKIQGMQCMKDLMNYVSYIDHLQCMYNVFANVTSVMYF